MSSDPTREQTQPTATLIERRHESRFVTDVSVRLRAVDDYGRWYAEQALARNVSLGGALLAGLDQPLRCGDLVILHYQERHGRFRVVWTRDSGGPLKILAAVQRLEDDECPWSDLLVENNAAGRASLPVS